MQYVVIKTGGKQYRVSEGAIIDVARMPQKASSEILLENVLLHVADGTVSVGAPLIDSVTVTAKILEHFKGDKIRVSKFKAKARYRKTIGFRPHLTRLQVEKIEAKTAGKSKPEAVSTKTKKEAVVKVKKTK